MKPLTPKPDKITVHHQINRSKPRSAHHLSDKEWEEAVVWSELVEQYPTGRKHDEEKLKELIREKTGRSYRTFKRYRSVWEKTYSVAALVKLSSSGGRGKHRISDEVEEIIQKHLKTHRGKLGADNIRVTDVFNDVEKECELNDLAVPSLNLIYNRKNATANYDAAKQGKASRLELSKLDATPGQTPKRTNPLERVQIDHTIADVVCGARYNLFHQVEEFIPIGRPWLTMAVCEASHAVIGLMLSFEAPSSSSLAHFMAHMVSPKEELMAEFDLLFEWVMKGVPGIVYTDRGSDFTSGAFGRGIQELGAQLEFRPGGAANFGGQIESYIGKSMGDIKLCPGATIKSFLKRGSTRNPNEEATMTIDEVYRHLMLWVMKYNHTSKSAIHMATPHNLWVDGLKRSIWSRNRIARIPDSRKDIILNFLPALENGRIINDDGTIRAHGLRYFSEAIRYLRRQGDKKKFEVRYSKYDISKVWLLEPDTNEYIELKCLEINKPYALAEWKATSGWLHKRNIDNADTETRIRALQEMEMGISKPKSKSKKTKRRMATKKAKDTERQKIAERSENVELIETFRPLERKKKPNSKVIKRKRL